MHQVVVNANPGLDNSATTLLETGNAFPLSIPPFNADWEKVLHLGSPRKYAKDELILSGDTPCKQMMYIQSGRVVCEHPGIKGNLKICFYAEKGTLFAEALMIHTLPTVASFFAAEDTVVYGFTLQTLKEQIIPNYPDLAFSLLQTMAYKVRLYSLHLESITLNDVCSQVCRLCYSLLAENKTLEKRPGISHQVMADILGVHRNTIVRAIRTLKDDGVIDTLSRTCIRVGSLEKLLARSTSEGNRRFK